MIEDGESSVATILSRSGGALDAERPPLLPEASDPATWERLRAHPFGRGRLEALFSEADSALGLPVEELPFSAFMRFYRDGDRAEYEGLYFERRRRLGLFALAALASPGGEGEPYIRALEEVLWSVCGEYTWCLPAHLSPPPRGEAGESPAGGPGAWPSPPAAPPPDRFVDLFSAETAFALAEIASLLGGRIAPEVAHRAAREARARTIEGLLDGGYRYGWEGARHNWAAVCAGGVGGAGLWLLDDPAELGALLARLGGALDSYLSGFPEDGACLEGMGYWTYGFGYFVAFAELLRERSSGAIDLLRAPGLSRRLGVIARFPQRTRLVGEAALSFSDSSSPFRYPLGFLCRLSSRMPGVLVPDFGLSEELAYDPCRRWAKQARDFAWFDPDAPSLEAAEGAGGSATWLPEAQWAVLRAPGARPPFALAAKGGHNDEPHNHNDIGSLILAAGSEVFLDDFGAGRYDRGYFGSERYDRLVASSLGHSVPIVEGQGQRAGPAFRCRAMRFEAEGDRMACRFEIAGAYGLPDLDSLERSIEAAASPDPRASLEDAFRFSGPGRREIRERFVSLLPMEAAGDSDVVIIGRDLRLRIRAGEMPLRIELSTRDFEAHRGPPLTARIVDFVYECGVVAALRFDMRIEKLRDQGA